MKTRVAVGGRSEPATTIRRHGLEVPGRQQGPAAGIPRHDIVEENARFTSVLGLVLMVLLVVQVGTLVAGVRHVLSVHIVAGVMIAALVVPKLATTGFRLIRYYRHDPAFVKKGPPPLFLRLLSPVLAAAFVLLLASGFLTLLGPSPLHGTARTAHGTPFAVVFVLIIVHTAAHLREALKHDADDVRLGPALAGRRLRFGTVLEALTFGAATGAVAATQASVYLAHWPKGGLHP